MIATGDLGKWPRVVVAGEPVTGAQAADILIRTNNWVEPYTDDPSWEWWVLEQARRLLGRPVAPPRPRDDPDGSWMRAMIAYWAALKDWSDRMGIAGLHHLHNDHVMWPWLAGPRGWCDPAGRIGPATWTIGKWPSAGQVDRDWQVIAGAFPFLDLRCQLIGDTRGPESVAAQWRVAGGSADLVDPTEIIAVPQTVWTERRLRMLAPGDGSSIDERWVREAMARVRDDAPEPVTVPGRGDPVRVGDRVFVQGGELHGAHGYVIPFKRSDPDTWNREHEVVVRWGSPDPNFRPGNRVVVRREWVFASSDLCPGHFSCVDCLRQRSEAPKPSWL